jgi:hypothetical protein
MSKKNIDTTLRDSFLERIKKPGCPSVKTIAEEMGLPKFWRRQRDELEAARGRGRETEGGTRPQGEGACRSRSAPDSSKKTSDILGREK